MDADKVRMGELVEFKGQRWVCYGGDPVCGLRMRNMRTGQCRDVKWSALGDWTSTGVLMPRDDFRQLQRQMREETAQRGALERAKQALRDIADRLSDG